MRTRARQNLPEASPSHGGEGWGEGECSSNYNVPVWGRGTAIRGRQYGFTLMELLVATAVGSILAAILFTLTGFGQRSFAIVANDSQLDAKSRYALDLLSRELKQATKVISLTTNSTSATLVLTNANSAIGISLTWSAQDRTLILNETGDTFLTNKVLLTACDQCNFTPYNHALSLNMGAASLIPAATLNDCKVIGFSWSCVTNIGTITNRLSQSSQIALRNKLN
jgi:prepilin-type N-terminal cleavage/methylation domain-containing protein